MALFALFIRHIMNTYARSERPMARPNRNHRKP
jgi:hypothetical protein